MARSADAWWPSSGFAAASPGGENVDAGLVALVAQPIPILVALFLVSIPWPSAAVRWPAANLKGVGEDRPLLGLSQAEPILWEFCVGGEPLSTSDDCLSPDTVDVESTGGDSGLPRMLEMLKDVYWGLQAGLSGGLPMSKPNE